MHMWIALKITWSLTNIRRIVEYNSSNYKLLKRGVRFAPYSTNICRIEHVRKFDRSPRDASRATNLLATLNPRLVFALVTTTFLPSKDTRGLIRDARACLRNFKRRAIECYRAQSVWIFRVFEFRDRFWIKILRCGVGNIGSITQFST